MNAEDWSEAASCFQLVSEILEARSVGNKDTLLGNGDDDLLAAIEEAEPWVKRMKKDLVGE